ncbi:hypothetical protein [Aliiglaciecola sp. M165]|uniref:hypothetical protein n=1 Tax=Aliiglaciecola sp. M165 TaxID=2593649 RepID=UPI00117E4358|nr:hypothetical protein [Aliiglaciecola sp. M165]TRY29936.1 hypothetical protein FM019_17390 [Aliiglaciecola sp. M165]
MPEISPFGWFHTAAGIIAVLSGIYTLVVNKVIRWDDLAGKVYLVCTLIAAASALAIFRQGGFNAAHALAILTLLALFVGTVAERTQLLKGLSAYAQAMCYSATLLFHMIPAITDGLMRLPVDDPVVKNIEDPLLKSFYLAFLITYVIGFALQVIWLRKQSVNT